MHMHVGPTYITYIIYIYIIVILASSFKMKHYHSFKFLPCTNSILYFTIKNALHARKPKGNLTENGT